MAATQATPLIAQQVALDQQLVQGGLLHAECAATFYAANERVPCRGVVLLLHGFTAGPWQFKELCQVLSQAGLHAYAARLVGHGTVSQHVFNSQSLPKSHQVQHFSQCADDGLKAVQELSMRDNVPLMVVGFSAGGALTADLLLRSPKAITRAVLIAPLLKPLGMTRRIFFRAVRYLPGAGKIIDRVPFAWQKAPPRQDGWLRPGQSAFHLGNVGALFAYAHGLKINKRSWKVPSQFILTANDDKIDPYACRAFAQKLPAPHAVYWFEAKQGVPHAMLSTHEHDHAPTRSQVHAIVQKFLVDGTATHNC